MVDRPVFWWAEERLGCWRHRRGGRGRSHPPSFIIPQRWGIAFFRSAQSELALICRRIRTRIEP